MAYQKTEDLLELAVWMQSDRAGVSISDIMTRFSVSRRTAERMKDMILNHFIQAEEAPSDDRKKRWRIPQGTLKDLFQFSAEDIAILDLAQNALVKENLVDESVKLRGIIEKIKASIKPQTYRRIEPDAELLLEAQGFVRRVGPKIKIDSSFVDILKEAMLSSRKVMVHLKTASGKISRQKVDPYGFLYGNKHYLIAYSEYAKDYHYFSLHKITAVKLLDEYFTRDESFSLEEYTKDCFGVFREDPVEVEWLFSKEVADDAENFIFHPSQITKRNKDGTLTVQFKAGGQREMDWHLYTWGDQVTVIKPQNQQKG